jgi:hypothetical protein
MTTNNVPRQKDAKELAAEFRAVHKWRKDIQPKEYPGYVDDEFNTNIVLTYINKHFNGTVTVENITAAVEANLLKLNGIDNNFIQARAVRQKQAIQEKAVRLQQEQMDAVALVAAQWVEQHAPTGMLDSNGDLFRTDSDKITEFIRRNHAGQPLTVEMLNEAFLTLGESAFTWFSTAPEDRVLRNMPKKERKLTEKQLIESGQRTDLSTRRSHADDGKIKTVAEVAEDAKKAFLKMNKLEDPESASFRTKAESISVSNHLGKLDHLKTAELRKIFAYNSDKSVNWKITYDLRWKAADQIEKLKGRR